MNRPRRHPNTPRHARCAFTLVELLVAVAVVALLTIGVGQIFRGIAQLSSTGSAVAEIESAARIVESLMRDDFSALSRVNPEQSFLAIRNRRLGDLNRNGQRDANEVGLYLSRDDAELDRRNGYEPYQRTSDGRPLSRAATVRLDEIAFIGFSGEPGGYTSYQQDSAGRTTIRAPFARIYYGHALRPPIDRPNNPNDPPRRLFYADGDFGSGPDAIGPSAYQENRFAPNSSALFTGRNQFAGDFVLTRQPLLLFGGIAAGYAQDANRNAPLTVEQSFVPYIRDHESESRFPFNGFGGVIDRYPTNMTPETRPNPRLIRHGRTDVVAQSLEDVIRWLQGRADEDTIPLGSNRPLPDASPFSTGIFNDPEANFQDFDGWLWGRYFSSESVNQNQQGFALLHNLKGIQSAIAGTLIRPLVDPQPPVFRVRDPLAWIEAGQRPAEANMDLHAILAQHCSSFEVAWTDGTRWTSGNPNAGPVEYRRPGESTSIPPRRILREGDLIWFDMDFTYADLHVAVGNSQTAQRRFPRPNPDPEIHAFGFPNTPPILRQALNGIAYRPTTGPMHVRRLAAANSGVVNPPPFDNSQNNRALPIYSLRYTHGAPDFDQEYLAIWGFQRPQGASERPFSVAGGYEDSPWPKPTMIRVRMTLHDAQKRLRNGKTFEYVFRITPGL